jgi:hypothetical protein
VRGPAEGEARLSGLGHIVIVRGASAAGRAVVRRIMSADGRPSVIDRRTSVSGAPSAKVDLRALTATSHAVADLVRRCGPISGIVLFAAADRYPIVGSRPDPRWERSLAEELVEIATLVRGLAPALGGRPVPLVLVEGPHPEAMGRPVRRSADEVVAALVRGLLAELAPQVELRAVRFVVGQEASLPGQILAAVDRQTEPAGAAALRTAPATGEHGRR